MPWRANGFLTANGDGSTSNDLIYVPRDTAEMDFNAYSATMSATTYNYTVDQQKQGWEKCIEQDSYLNSHRGQYAVRGAAFAPSVFRSDFSFAQEIARPVLGLENGFEVRLDILNVGNLLDHNWGLGKNVVTTSPLIVSGSPADAQGRLVYELRNIGGNLIDHTFDPSATINDVYRFQLSLRYRF